jgi:hypothetical protein
MGIECNTYGLLRSFKRGFDCQFVYGNKRSNAPNGGAGEIGSHRFSRAAEKQLTPITPTISAMNGRGPE